MLAARVGVTTAFIDVNVTHISRESRVCAVTGVCSVAINACATTARIRHAFIDEYFAKLTRCVCASAVTHIRVIAHGDTFALYTRVGITN